MGVQGRLKKATHCSYCAVLVEHPEIEHVFPDSWYADGVQQQHMLKVPACKPCNEKYRWAEERTREAFATMVDDDHPGAQGVFGRVKRAIDGRGKKPEEAARRERRAQRMRNNLRVIPAQEGISANAFLLKDEHAVPTWLQFESGPRAQDWSFRYGYAATRIDPDARDLFFDKLIRGCYRHLIGAPLSPGTITDHRPCQDGTMAVEVAQKMFPMWNSPSFKVVGLADGQSSLWVFELLGQILWFGASGAPAAAFASNGRADGEADAR